MNCSNCGMNYQSDSIIEVDGDSVFCAKCAVKRLESKLVSAKQRELELLAVIENIRAVFNANSNFLAELATIKTILENNPSQALREHEANVIEELLDAFPFFQSEEGLWLANAIAVWAEERRQSNGK